MSFAQPFARALSVAAAIAAVASRHFTPAQFALANTPYRSRGKGLGRHSGKKWGGHPTNWLAKLGGQTNGQRECERRQRQIALGIIKVS